MKSTAAAQVSNALLARERLFNGRRLINLSTLREIVLFAKRRLLGVPRLNHNRIRAEQTFTAVHHPIIPSDGHRIVGLSSTARLPALLVVRLISERFRHRDLPGLLGKQSDKISAGVGQLGPASATRPRPDHPNPANPPLPDQRHLGVEIAGQIPDVLPAVGEESALHQAMLITHRHS